jgi:hypothetical protein
VTDREWTFLVWALLGIGLVACVVTASLTKGRVPTLGSKVGRLTSHPWGRILLVVGWMWLGWHAFAR